MPSVSESNGPDLSPWDHAITGRVQPVLSALFHDMMGPLTLIKNRTYLIRKHLEGLHDDPANSEECRAKLASVLLLLDVLDEAAHRIHRGMAVPRDAAWAAVLEDNAFDPEQVITQIGLAMRGTSDPVSPQPATL